MHILLADDHPLFADALRELVLNDIPDSRLTVVGNLAETLTSLERDRFEMVIMDLHMPGTNGVDGLEQVLQKLQGAPLAVISGIADVEEVTQVISLGAKAFLPKTMPTKALSEALRLVAAGGTYVPAEYLSALASSHAQAKDNAVLLSARERQVIELLSEGKSNKEIGGVLGLQEITIKLYLRNAYRKLGARNRVEAAAAAAARGLVRRHT
jgi:two-component system, NarL family, nitrate/nitrite response regulator NarL